MSAHPPGEPRLVADAMLGRLARWLRILGFDTLYEPHRPDSELARLARAERRILLTRDTALSRRRGVRALLVASDRLEDQLSQVVRALGLAAVRTFSRCPVCNEVLEAVPRGWAWGHVPAYTFCTQREFRLCPGCNRFYWRGTHWQHMQETVSELAERENTRKEERTG